jgi:hypothetical protein
MVKQLQKIGTLCLLLMLAIVSKAESVTAQWNWKQGIPASIANVHVEGTTGSVASDVDGIELYVDATHGKLKTNGDNVQFNAGTILRVPVKSAGDEVTVEAHSYNFKNI